MERILRIAVALLALAALPVPPAAPEGAGAAAGGGTAGTESAEARAILDRMDAAMAWDECVMRLSFEDTKASGQSRRFEAEVDYAKGAGTLITFLSPAREKGKRILMIGDSMWMGAPNVSRAVRLSGKDAFMGTSFTNDDIMNMDKADDYGARIVEAGPAGWTLELAARRRSLPYQRVVLEVGRDFLPARQSMYLLSGELSKTIEYSLPRDFGGRIRPQAIRIRDATLAGASTLVLFESMAEARIERSRLSPDGFMK